MNSLLAVLLVAVAAAPAAADEQSDETERVVMRHLEASHAADASAVARDYAEDAIVIFGEQATVGLPAIQRFFDDLYARTKMDLTYTRRVFSGNLGVVVWTMGDLRGSDTFVVENGKIVRQTGVVFAPPRQ